MKALIIGAGIGGLAATIGLRRAGVEVTLYGSVPNRSGRWARGSRCGRMR